MSIQTDYPDVGASGVFTALSNENRRIVLQTLVRSHDGTASIDEVRSAIEANSDGGSTRDRREAAIERRLHHTDLPRLADLGLVRYDAQTGDVELTADRPTVELLDSIDDEVDRVYPSR